MSILLILAFLFYIGSLIGWVMELIFRRIITKSGKWINPGFLIGPYLPIYGFGLCILYIAASSEKYFLDFNNTSRKLILFAVMALLMTLIEYIAGIIFIKKMKVKLWDYTEEKWNVQGIICPKYSMIWAFFGAVYYFVIHPRILFALDWLSENLAFSFFIGIFYGIFIIDFIYSAKILVKIKKFAEDKKIIIKLEEYKMSVIHEAEKQKQKASFMFIIASKSHISENLKHYHEKIIKFKRKK